MKPLVYINGNHAHRLEERFPGRIGLMCSPDRARPGRGLPVVVDNGRYSVWASGKQWSENRFWHMLDRIQKHDRPKWVVVPDVVGDACATFREWETWSPRLRERGLPLAIAVQDGMTADAVRQYSDPDVIFVGGTRPWKLSTVWNWCHKFAHVHIGRVNGERWLWDAHRAGARSTDGTVWFRAPHKIKGLIRYLKRSSAELGPAQLELQFSETFKP